MPWSSPSPATRSRPGFCHCTSCRSWSAAPVNAFSLWKPEAVKITKGDGNIGVYHKTERSYRKFCKVCGGHLLTDHPLWGLVDVYAATIPSLSPRAEASRQLSGNRPAYEGRAPKMKDLPKEMGGSGDTLPE